MAASSPPVRVRRGRTSRWVVILAVVVLVGVVGASAAVVVSVVRDRGGLIGSVAVPDDLRPVVQAASKRCRAVPPAVLAAQITAESGWDARAVSPAGARGVAQFMPAVWEQYGFDANGDGRASVWDPVDAIHSAAALNCTNRKLVKGVSGDRLRNTLAAYNAGYGAVLRYDGVPPYPETEAYVERVLRIAETIQVN